MSCGVAWCGGVEANVLPKMHFSVLFSLESILPPCLSIVCDLSFVSFLRSIAKTLSTELRYDYGYSDADTDDDGFGYDDDDGFFDDDVMGGEEDVLPVASN